MKVTQNRLRAKIQEVYSIEPNDLGFTRLNYWYRKINIFFKTAPFVIVIPTAILVSSIVVYLFGLLAVKLVSILQYGF